MGWATHCRNQSSPLVISSQYIADWKNKEIYKGNVIKLMCKEDNHLEKCEMLGSRTRKKDSGSMYTR